MIHPATELRFINPEIGHGVVATEFIPKGTITWALDKLDREFTPEKVARLDEVYRDLLDTYCYRNNKGNYILCWDHARYVNHSFKSNCITTPYEFEIAIRDIYPGEELTDDYGYLNIDRPFRAKDEGVKRRVVYPDDLLKYYKVWDKLLQEAMVHFNEVDQPLAKILNSKTLKKACSISSGEEKMDSILTCYFDPEK